MNRLQAHQFLDWPTPRQRDGLRLVERVQHLLHQGDPHCPGPGLDPIHDVGQLVGVSRHLWHRSVPFRGLEDCRVVDPHGTLGLHD